MDEKVPVRVEQPEEERISSELVVEWEVPGL